MITTRVELVRIVEMSHLHVVDEAFIEHAHLLKIYKNFLDI